MRQLYDLNGLDSRLQFRQKGFKFNPVIALWLFNKRSGILFTFKEIHLFNVNAMNNFIFL